MSSLPTEFLDRLGYALCEERGDGKFALLYDPPAWFQEIWGPEAAAGNLLALADRSPFLEAFLADAEEHWNSDSESPLESGAWIEQPSAGGEIPLEARAWRLGGRRILSIQSSQGEFQKQTHVLQTARDSMLVHERLLKEIQKKEILLHCIIHDLSQPLTAMRGCFDVLARETATPAAKRLIELGRQQSERQDSMIREVLQAFSMDIHSAMGASEAARGRVQHSQMRRRNGGGIRAGLRIAGRSDSPRPSNLGSDRSRAHWNVAGETSRLMRIFSNLVENALRHAPKGTFVTIGLEDDGGHIKAFVDDEGPGLPKEFKPSEAFALFSRGKQGGGKAGMGLYFCRVTVERWGGSIGCESLPDRGARFWFRLPRAAVAESTSAPSLPASACGNRFPPVPAPLKMLLAEDDPTIRELTERLLERDGHEVVAVASGIEALLAFPRWRFDVILLDEEMPGMTGTEVTKAIRSREAPDGKRQVIFALSGNSSENDRERLLAAGFDACFGKPFHAEEVLAAAARFSLGTAATPAIIDDGERPRERIAASRGPADPPLLARVGGDAKLLRSIAKHLLERLSGQASQDQAGHRAQG